MESKLAAAAVGAVAAAAAAVHVPDLPPAGLHAPMAIPDLAPAAFGSKGLLGLINASCTKCQTQSLRAHIMQTGVDSKDHQNGFSGFLNLCKM